MFWAAFGHEYRSSLISLDGSVTGEVIRDLYASYLPDLLEPGDIFMQDNAPVHTARIVKQILHELGIIVMIWPPFSPDLNPIENLWALMKAEIYRLHPELETASDTDDTLGRLVEAAKEAWHAIDEAILRNLIDTMPHRVAAVIVAEGWYTKY
jgi:transposase